MDDERRGDRDTDGSSASRPRRNTRPRDSLGRPMPYGTAGVDDLPSGVVRTPRESLAEARRLMAEGRPFHAHEVLEDAWKAGPVAERQLWRGLAQIAVGITHAARGNRVGAGRLVERGIANIEPYERDRPYGLDIADIITWSAGALAAIAAESPVTLSPPPL
jgi:hypothetical protein